eukprot:4598040-Pleurochrysis_carterae.AAC.1
MKAIIAAFLNQTTGALLCEPWDGTQGAEFEQRFTPQFEAALHAIQKTHRHPETALAGTRSQASTAPAENEH